MSGDKLFFDFDTCFFRCNSKHLEFCELLVHQLVVVHRLDNDVENGLAAIDFEPAGQRLLISRNLIVNAPDDCLIAAIGNGTLAKRELPHVISVFQSDLLTFIVLLK